MLASLSSFVTYEEDGTVTPGTNLPMVDGGTEVSHFHITASSATDATAMNSQARGQHEAEKPCTTGL